MNQTYIRRRIKAEAQVNLSGNWMKVISLFFIAMLFMAMILGLLPLRMPSLAEIEAMEWPELYRLILPKEFGAKTIASFVTVIVLSFIVLSPLSVGVCRFFLGVAKGEKPKVREVFLVYTDLKTVFSSVWLALLVRFISIFWSVLFVSVPTLLLIADTYIGSALITPLARVLSYVAPTVAFLWNSRYTFALYIFAEGGKGAFESLCECIELMRGRTKECMMLRFTYFFWEIISIYVPPLWFVYFALSGTVYAKYLAYFRGERTFSDEAPHPGI